VFRRDRPFLRLQMIFFLCGSSFFLTTHVILVLVRERFTFTPFELALWMSVTPQFLLALTSPLWGRVLDRIGMARCRLVIGVLLSGYLACYFAGIMTGMPFLIVAGSVLLGIGNGGGQVTWALASVHFAPTPREVPVYNGIHFVLNGIRGLVMPWIGAVLLVLLGTWAVLAGLAIALLSLPVNLQLLRSERGTAPLALGEESLAAEDSEYPAVGASYPVPGGNEGRKPAPSGRSAVAAVVRGRK
jgi:MFS family permease